MFPDVLLVIALVCRPHFNLKIFGSLSRMHIHQRSITVETEGLRMSHYRRDVQTNDDGRAMSELLQQKQSDPVSSFSRITLFLPHAPEYSSPVPCHDPSRIAVRCRRLGFRVLSVWQQSHCKHFLLQGFCLVVGLCSFTADF